ncbi:hypothetical protein BJ508DRAFT_303623 [Ascobolus immersus RN42]|uniref:Uncharacterized protein n=1 Tax=Ascobolus immersus RN42 TaxID=1160509 RepID=A0A3N4IEE4_ASCIM|nr:hypothetical protein BJ508DRAFT_303623 [Ascobolus immersus RN42]
MHHYQPQHLENEVVEKIPDYALSTLDQLILRTKRNPKERTKKRKLAELIKSTTPGYYMRMVLQQPEPRMCLPQKSKQQHTFHVHGNGEESQPTSPYTAQTKIQDNRRDPKQQESNQQLCSPTIRSTVVHGDVKSRLMHTTRDKQVSEIDTSWREVVMNSKEKGETSYRNEKEKSSK